VVVEAGANIGAHTVPFAKLVGTEGRIYAFEPQRLVHQTLCGNLALNELENVYALAVAAGDRAGQVRMPVIRYGADANYGGQSLANEEGEAVAMGTVDALRLERLDLLKADVEGTEELVIKGAEITLRKSRPTLYLENDRIERSESLLTRLAALGYEMWWHLPALFEPHNFRGNANNVFGAIVSLNILAQHPTRELPVPNLRKVRSFDEWPI
jgi:FkbM family methyltransferase